MTVNDPELKKLVGKRICGIWGEESLIRLEKRMTTDDFAYYSQSMPALYMRLGVNSGPDSVRNIENLWDYINNELNWN